MLPLTAHHSPLIVIRKLIKLRKSPFPVVSVVGTLRAASVFDTSLSALDVCQCFGRCTQRPYCWMLPLTSHRSPLTAHPSPLIVLTAPAVETKAATNSVNSFLLLAPSSHLPLLNHFCVFRVFCVKYNSPARTDSFLSLTPTALA